MLHQRRVVMLVGGFFLGGLLGMGLIFGSTMLTTSKDAEPFSATMDADDSTAAANSDMIQGPSRPQTPTLEPAPIIGAPAPDFELKDSQGEIYRLRELQGHVVLLNFWATWCRPCEVEMPTLQSKYDHWRDADFIVLGINFDESGEVVHAFKEALNLSFPLLLDPGGSVQRLYNIRGYPSSVIVDTEGVIRTIHIGILTEGRLEDYLEQVGLQS
jgi:cytochrome c biogenesis protein CcmG/thiol:disulfide interchange protein DsbE